MSLTAVLDHAYSNGTKRRGRISFLSGAVALEPLGQDGIVYAKVRGGRSQPFAVTIKANGGMAHVSCDCPFGGTYSARCDHAWAAILAADAAKRAASTPPTPATAQAATAPPLRIVPATDHRSVRIDPEFDEDDNFVGFDPRDAIFQRLLEKAERLASGGGPPTTSRAGAGRSNWHQLVRAMDVPSAVAPPAAQAGVVQPLYVVDVDNTWSNGKLCLGTFTRSTRKDGTPGKLKPLIFSAYSLPRTANPIDELICSVLAGQRDKPGSYYDGASYFQRADHQLEPVVVRTLLAALFETGRFFYRDDANSEPKPLRRDAGAPYELVLALRPAGRGDYELGFHLRRGEQEHPLADTEFLLDGSPGLCLIDGTLADFESFGCALANFRFQATQTLRVAKSDAVAAVGQLMSLPAPPRLELPHPWMLDLIDGTPLGQLELSTGQGLIFAQISYRYGATVVPGMRPSVMVVDPAARQQLRRNRAAEQALALRLPEAGFDRTLAGDWVLSPKNLPDVVRTLSQEDWTILADGKLFRKAGKLDVSVSSGIDWFDLDGKVDFEGITADLPSLLEAVRQGQRFVKLDDGSMGMLPEEWLSQHGLLLGMAKKEGTRLRFARTQVFLLDQMLAEQPEVRFDASFTELRDKLRKFDGIKPAAAPAKFVGKLRPYQQHGLAWMHFLDEFGWGGCLADDMGLGKTVQVLAWLAGRSNGDGNGGASKAAHAPRTALAVVPRSVVFNWVDEARKFAPQLRVLTYHGTGRHEHLPKLDEYDLVLTTYHTLRRDIGQFAEREFDCVILDEAQAIKNAQAQAAKAVRLLKVRRRLALTGTPVENRLGDLWSLFEFLNPGMLGSANVFQSAFAADRRGADASIDILRRGLRPFLLRRTKEAVAPELPGKTEETVYCEMTTEQAKRYAELRDYYRALVLGKVDELGLAKSKIHVLEALLRLRQAACHPRLLDDKIPAADSGKFDALLPMLEEVTAGGHKSLIFSQFTSFLAILRRVLDKQKVVYEYLDGRTRDRGARVNRFQTDPDCPLFLISLKAGGLGLNLTAADYVFILDPWWNPAVEAQAIDRAHRIGQDKKVFAYRMIARGTVEEKILELQGRKRDLAASIITQANSLISEMSREDLEVLLS